MLSGLNPQSTAFKGLLSNALYDVVEKNDSGITVTPNKIFYSNPCVTKTEDDFQFVQDILAKIKTRNQKPLSITLPNDESGMMQAKNWLLVEFPSVIIRFFAGDVEGSTCKDYKNSAFISEFEKVKPDGMTPSGLHYKDLFRSSKDPKAEYYNRRELSVFDGADSTVYPRNEMSQLAKYILDKAAQMPQAARNILEAIIQDKN